MSKVTKEVEIINTHGLHVRRAAILVQIAEKFNSEIFLIREGHQVDAKSIMSILTLGAEQGAKIIISAEGDDSQEAVDAIDAFLKEEE